MIVSSLPWVVQVVLTCFNQQNLEIMVQVGKSTGDYAAGAATTADNDVHFIWDGHDGYD